MEKKTLRGTSRNSIAVWSMAAMMLMSSFNLKAHNATESYYDTKTATCTTGQGKTS